jgi:hypothetical protein
MTAAELRDILKEIPEDDERFAEISQMGHDLEAVRYLLEGILHALGIANVVPS